MQKTIIPGLHWFFANEVSQGEMVYSMYGIMYRSDSFTINSSSKVKPTVQVISHTQLAVTVPALQGAMKTQATYDAIKHEFGNDMPESLRIAHQTFFGTYMTSRSPFTEFKILVEIANGDKLDLQVFTPKAPEGKIGPVMKLLHTPYEAFGEQCVLSEVFCSFRVALKEENHRYYSAPSEDVVDSAFSRLTLQNEQAQTLNSMFHSPPSHLPPFQPPQTQFQYHSPYQQANPFQSPPQHRSPFQSSPFQAPSPFQSPPQQPQPQPQQSMNTPHQQGMNTNEGM